MRTPFAIISVLLLAVLWLGPLPELARSSFAAHMALHMGVVAVASACIALSLSGGRFDPALRRPGAFSPVPASIAELVIVWTWHAPALHHFARSSTSGFVLEQGSFALAGIWLWLSAIGGDGSRRGAGVAGLLLTSMHMTLLGALLALTPRPLYPHLGGIAGLTPLEDQHLGGAIMLLIGGLAYLAGGLGVTAGIIRRRSALRGAAADGPNPPGETGRERDRPGPFVRSADERTSRLADAGDRSWDPFGDQPDDHPGQVRETGYRRRDPFVDPADEHPARLAADGYRRRDPFADSARENGRPPSRKTRRSP